MPKPMYARREVIITSRIRMVVLLGLSSLLMTLMMLLFSSLVRTVGLPVSVVVVLIMIKETFNPRRNMERS